MAFTITYEFEGNLYVNITNQCTNDCDFCVRNNPNGISDGVDLWLDREPDVSEIVEDIKKWDLSKYGELVFCGYGEPLVRAYDVIEVCKNIRTISDVKIRVNTNGQANLHYGCDVTKDLEGMIDVCSISLNASNKVDYHKCCKSAFGEDAFDAIIDFAKKCKENVPRVIFSVVDVLEKNEIEACRGIAAKAGVEFRVRNMIN